MTQNAAETVLAQNPEVVVPAIQDPDWQNFRECLDAPDDLMPRVNRGPKTRLTDEEIDVITDYCGQCIVRPDCLANALIKDVKTGVQGGLSQRERKPFHDTYGTAKQRNPIPARMWRKGIERAATLRAEYVGSPAHQARRIDASKRIVAALKLVPAGLELGADRSTPFHQQFAKKVGISSVLMRQELVTLIENGTVAARTIRGSRNRVAIIAVRLREAS